jgi:hypothetical protein
MKIEVKFWEDIIEITGEGKKIIIYLADLRTQKTSSADFQTSHEEPQQKTL